MICADKVLSQVQRSNLIPTDASFYFDGDLKPSVLRLEIVQIFSWSFDVYGKILLIYSLVVFTKIVYPEWLWQVSFVPYFIAISLSVYIFQACSL